MGIDYWFGQNREEPWFESCTPCALRWIAYGESWGQRQNKTQVIVIYRDKELWDLLLNDLLTDFHISVIDENRLMVAYRMKDVCIPNSHNTNIYIAAFTTSHARLRLYKELEKLGEQVLYHDTDSIVYVSRPGGYEVRKGICWGMEDELHGEHMVGMDKLRPQELCIHTIGRFHYVKSRVSAWKGRNQSIDPLFFHQEASGRALYDQNT